MGFVILLAAGLLWWWLARDKSLPEGKHPYPTSSSRPPNLQVGQASSIIETSVSLTDQVAPTPPLQADEITRCNVVAPENRCAVCRTARPPQFATCRLVVCKQCIELIKGNMPINISAIDSIINETNGIPFMDWGFMEAVINENESVGRITTKVKHAGLVPSNLAPRTWLKFMRAYHLGLISCADRVTYPEEPGWHELAKKIRMQDNRRCNICRSTGVLHVHHIIPLSNYGMNDPRNLVTLCYECHRSQHPHVLFSLD
ncbi:HNH endonuclease [Rhodanobacter sp. FDAARGOS 1247]|uniref:HNH endonuclease n=1 Tax=Rhodanobacter sp. FDAARGOS 1247 TaxID=2778082 RepID=UPI001950B0E9|nr:HNH endonuclease [Rhodanobacter sp. FDAARGOS 1247]QRP62372.1 HNH endonuclease [Rhodanobacter sp. FDAARGOS 1247]